MKSMHLGMPEGVRDEIGSLASGREELERKLKDLFIANGCELIRTPTFEFADVFSALENGDADLYTFTDRSGELLALRSDMTASIARVLASHYELDDYPVSLAYCEKMYRSSRTYRGKAHEFTQAGVEYIGLATEEADENVLVLLSDALEVSGLSSHAIHIGDSRFLPALFQEWGLSEKALPYIKRDIAKKNFVALTRDLTSAAVSPERIAFLLELMTSAGRRSFLGRVRDQLGGNETLSSVSRLSSLLERLYKDGISEHVVIDFSVVAYASYYTGIVFQAYAPGSGRNVAVGGRYDRLLGTYGRDLPAIGFAIEVEDLPLPLLPQKRHVFTIGDGPRAREGNARLRSEGAIVESSSFADDVSLAEYLKHHSFDQVIDYRREEK